MDTLPKELLLLFLIIFGAAVWVLSWVIKCLRKEEANMKRKMKQMDRRIKREENLSSQLAALLNEHDVRLDDVDTILDEMRGLHNSS